MVSAHSDLMLSFKDLERPINHVLDEQCLTTPQLSAVIGATTVKDAKDLCQLEVRFFQFWSLLIPD
jgi:hypothetical protein